MLKIGNFLHLDGQFLQVRSQFCLVRNGNAFSNQSVDRVNVS